MKLTFLMVVHWTYKHHMVWYRQLRLFCLFISIIGNNNQQIEQKKTDKNKNCFSKCILLSMYGGYTLSFCQLTTGKNLLLIRPMRFVCVFNFQHFTVVSSCTSFTFLLFVLLLSWLVNTLSIVDRAKKNMGSSSRCFRVVLNTIA